MGTTTDLKKRLVSGVQPSGLLHLGNYHGAVKSWLTLQHTHDAYFMIADFHALTTQHKRTPDRKFYTMELAIDLLALGIDPATSCLFCQSDVNEHAELYLLLGMITPLGWLQRTPSYKDKEELSAEWNTHGFLGYPLLMAADILLYQAAVVPVGIDQRPHLELTREIARRFNQLFNFDLFPIPQDLLTETPTLPGLDGQKMSKSYGNTIPLSATESDIDTSLKKMKTDPKRQRRLDPGTPEHCPVFAYHQLYSNTNTTATIKTDCETARIGCVDCKQQCAKAINDSLALFREKRHYFNNHRSDVMDYLQDGQKKATTIAKTTMAKVKEHIGLRPYT